MFHVSLCNSQSLKFNLIEEKLMQSEWYNLNVCALYDCPYFCLIDAHMFATVHLLL